MSAGSLIYQFEHNKIVRLLSSGVFRRDDAFAFCVLNSLSLSEKCKRLINLTTRCLSIPFIAAAFSNILAASSLLPTANNHRGDSGRKLKLCFKK